MKANELMIGDWVEPDQCMVPTMYTRVAMIMPDGVHMEEAERQFDFEELHPIYVTKEILEANGITLLEVGDNGPATPKKHLNRYEKWFIHTTWKDTFLWYDRMADHWHLQDMSGACFLYVHELQHALRLAGLADIADNFKIKKGEEK